MGQGDAAVAHLPGASILVDAGPATGRVEAVSLRSTQLRDIRGTLWHIPNGQVTRIGNLSRIAESIRAATLPDSVRLHWLVVLDDRFDIDSAAARIGAERLGQQTSASQDRIQAILPSLTLAAL